jgi:hypothetical protein
MADVINKIQTEILGEEEVRRLTGLIGEQEDAFRKLAASMKAMGASEGEVRNATRGIAADLAKLNAQMEAATKQAGSRGKGRGILEFGRIAQDAQYGLSGITNNLVEILPKVGLFAVAVQAISTYAEPVAGHINKWADSLDASQQGLKDNLTILGRFIDGLSLTGSKIRETFAAVANEAGLIGIATTILGDPEGDALKAEGAAGKQVIGKITSNAADERKKAMLDTIKQFGGPEFDAILTQGLGREATDLVRGQVAKALETGDEAAFGQVRMRLGRQKGLGPEAALALEANLPANKKQAEEIAKAQKEAADHNVEVNKKLARDQSRMAFEDMDAEFKMAKALNEDEERAREKDARIVRRGEEQELSGRMKWVNQLQREQAQARPKMFEGVQSYLASIQTAGRGKDPQLERIEQILQMQLDALKQSAQVGP